MPHGQPPGRLRRDARRPARPYWPWPCGADGLARTTAGRSSRRLRCLLLISMQLGPVRGEQERDGGVVAAPFARRAAGDPDRELVSQRLRVAGCDQFSQAWLNTSVHWSASWALPYPSVASITPSKAVLDRSTTPARNSSTARGSHKLVVCQPSSEGSSGTGSSTPPSGWTATMSPSPICASTSHCRHTTASSSVDP